MPDRRDQPFAERHSPATTDSTDPTQPGARDARGDGDGNRGEGGGQTGADGGAAGGGSDRAPADDNPFAPPPEGRPDQPWRPRRPADGSSPWGSQWSSRQPGPGQGGFGDRPEDPDRGSAPGPGQNPPPGPSLRWDPTDPAQRRARYSLLAGMWAFFFALFDMTEIALLLGSLALYWAISSLRAKPKPPTPETPEATPAPPAKPQTTAAVTGLVTAILSLSIVAATFTMQIVYRDYYTCVDDALTKTGSLACNDLLPDALVPVFGVKE